MGNKITICLLALMLYLTSLSVTAWAISDSDKSANIASQINETQNEEPIELDGMVVSGGDLGFDEEVMLRIVRQAFDADRSERREDRDKWVCWLEKPTGTSFTYLGCARNGDIWALRPDSLMRDFAPVRTAGYGKIIRSTRPVNRARLKSILKSLPGSDDFDKEFLTQVMQGQKPPRDIPSDKELNHFARAWLAVGELHRNGAQEDNQIEAIRKSGLSLKRYNRIAELTQIFQSVENQVAELIKEKR